MHKIPIINGIVLFYHNLMGICNLKNVKGEYNINY